MFTKICPKHPNVPRTRFLVNSPCKLCHPTPKKTTTGVKDPIVRGRISEQVAWARCFDRLAGWADREKLRAIYTQARAEGKVVDHIVPLYNSDLVCGLHCEANLQLISHRANCMKGSLFVVD